MRRTINTILMAAALLIPATMTAYADDHAHRYYDKDSRDWHEWNDREERAYHEYAKQDHKAAKEWRKASKKQQQDYWRWRHNHKEFDHDDRH